MSGQFGVRNLLLATVATAVCMSLMIYTIRNQDSSIAFALLVSLGMVATTFVLFALAFAVLLPLGIIEAMARETAELGTSPFADDRLPDQQIAPRDIEPSR